MTDWNMHGHDIGPTPETYIEVAETNIPNLRDRVKCVMCVGALCGYELGKFAQHFSNATAVAIEAMPEAFSRFLDKDRPCCPDRVLTFCQAISDIDGEVTMHVSSINTMHSMAGSIECPGGSQRTVKSSTLKTFCEQNGIVPDFLMIDVEGVTARVLRGAGDILDSVLVVLAETEEAGAAVFHGGDTDAEVDGILTGHGLQRVFKRGNHRQSNSLWVRRP